jgi:hypothetical protein
LSNYFWFNKWLKLVLKKINRLGDDVEIDIEFWAKITNTIISRLRDKNHLVRIYAIQTLARLQDPTNNEDQIFKEYIRMSENDSNK